MLSQYLQSVTGVQDLGVACLIAALTVFAGVVVYTFRLDKGVLATMAALPLENDTPGSEPPEEEQS